MVITAKYLLIIFFQYIQCWRVYVQVSYVSFYVGCTRVPLLRISKYVLAFSQEGVLSLSSINPFFLKGVCLPDSSPVIFIEHTAVREVVEQGMMRRENGRRQQSSSFFIFSLPISPNAPFLSTHLSLRCISLV